MRLKTCFFLTVLGCTAIADPMELLAQPGGGGGGFPGGRGGGGRPQMDPEALWLRMSNGADTIDLNKNPQSKFLVQMSGGQMPPDGILTKAAFQTAMAQRAAQRGQIPGGFTPGAVPVPGSGVPMVDRKSVV